MTSNADVCVIGGGLCGLSVARHCAEKGLSVALLEADALGHAATRHSAGHVMTGFLPSPKDMMSLLGEPLTGDLQDWSHESKLALLGRFKELGVEASIRHGYLLTGYMVDHQHQLEAMAEYWCKHIGIPGVRVLQGADLQSVVVSPVFTSALFDPTAFSVDPEELQALLRRMANHFGISVFEGSAAQHVESAGLNRFRVKTRNGDVIARSIAVCVGAGSTNFLERRVDDVIRVATAYLVSDVLHPEVLYATLPSLLAGSDCTLNPIYWTVTSGPKLIFGGLSGDRDSGPDDSLTSKLSKYFPSLPPIPISEMNQAAVDHTRSGLPYIFELKPGLWLAGGFSGVGLAVSYGAGAAIAAALVGDRTRTDLLCRLPHG